MTAVSEKYLHIPISYGGLPEGWVWSRLDDICEGVFDCPHSTPKLTVKGPLVVRTQDIISGVFRADEAGHVSEETYLDRISRVTPSHGDLLYSREGTYFGIAAEVPENTRVCLGQRMVLIRPSKKRMHFGFLRYWLNSPIMAAHIHGYREGSVAERLNLPTIRALPILIPPFSEQVRIAHILGTLDDKIELNRRMIATLEAMAQAFFQSWFLDSADEGMKEVMLGDLVSFARQAISPTGFPNEVFDHYSLPAFDAGRLPARDPGGSIKSNKTLVPADAVLLSKLNPRIPRVWLPNVGKASRSIASTEFLVVQPNKNVSREFLFGLFTSPAFLQTLEGMVTGTSGSHQRVKPDAVLQILVSLPPVSVMERYTDVVGSLLQKAQANIDESQSLGELRDTLLPKLLSGELNAAKLQVKA